MKEGDKSEDIGKNQTVMENKKEEEEKEKYLKVVEENKKVEEEKEKFLKVVRREKEVVAVEGESGGGVKEGSGEKEALVNLWRKFTEINTSTNPKT